ncbi:hypothetical protein J8281_02065 [Aquimarina sp. U1-2]|uniref:hypothetical protein n=1 Tax=Aquimarina sp. U1-2 TaxID=2823141 RepID=UPI001AECF7CB|nr:hypothetical protein [Aquimarina sp. U1-2]MBP2830959.1 hypothetical protein [Aquimarina sp. U1-2]
MIRFLFVVTLTFFSLGVFAQKSINDFKYIVIPKSFEFLTKEDAYQLNSLTQFLFNKYGFNAYVRGKDMPNDLAENSCKGLLVDLKKKSSLFVSKLMIELTDCQGNVVFLSSVGTSREKDFKKAYQEALRDAFKDIQNLNYQYNGAGEGSENNIVQVTPIPLKEKPSTSMQPAQKGEALRKAPITSQELKVEDSNSKTFILNDKEYVFEKKEYGFELLENLKESTISSAKIYKLKRDNTYLVEGGDWSGSGHFDSFGNFILERINPATQKIILDTFARR